MVSRFGSEIKVMKMIKLQYLAISLMAALVASWLGMQAAFASPVIPPQAPTCQRKTIETPKEPAILDKASISFINPEHTSLQVTCSNEAVDLTVADKNLTARLAGLSQGDIVNLTYKFDNANKDNIKRELIELDSVAIRIAPRERFVALGSMALILFAVSGVVLWIARGNVLALRELFVGTDRRLSNSKSQAAFWFFLLLTSYLGINYLRVTNGGFDFLGGISIPENLLFLSGFSAFTYVGAKAITKAQVNRDPNSKPSAPEGAASLADYVTDDEGNTDFGDFQMCVITLLAGIIFLLRVFNYTGSVYLSKSIQMPDLDPTILSLFGLSQSGYLAKKAVQASGAKDSEALKKPGTNDKKAADSDNGPQPEAGVDKNA